MRFSWWGPKLDPRAVVHRLLSHCSRWWFNLRDGGGEPLRCRCLMSDNWGLIPERKALMLKWGELEPSLKLITDSGSGSAENANQEIILKIWSFVFSSHGPKWALITAKLRTRDLPKMWLSIWRLYRNRVGSVFKKIAKTENGCLAKDACKISTAP